jgi:hypothetical protein
MSKSTPSPAYRNQLLYNRLTKIFGKVLVAREGTEDEEYRICCPFCGDKRHRLYVNCKWGVYDAITNTSNIHLVHCYNESCVQPSTTDDRTWQIRCERRQRLFDQVYHEQNRHIVLNPITATKKPDNEPAELPGRVIKFQTLATKYPQHPAVTYMQYRGFDPKLLGTKYGFMYCDKVVNNLYRMAENTIIMPILKGNMLYSWIARAVGDTRPDIWANHKGWKKYYNMPGRPLSVVGYNLDQALCYSTVVLVEGVLDVIKTGDYATCLFTKTVPANLKKRIIHGLTEYGSKATLVIMLDPDQSAPEKRAHSLHHIEAAASVFQPYIPNILKVYLPDGEDPGSMTTADITNIIRQKAIENNIPINLDPIKQYDFRTITQQLADTASARSRLTPYGTNAHRRGITPKSGITDYSSFDGQ